MRLNRLNFRGSQGRFGPFPSRSGIARRLARRRGVSPIIATILLVAITVVLAAVLYVLIAGLTHSSASVPYTIAMGTPSWSGTTPTNYGIIHITGATTGLTTGLFSLTVLTSDGTGIPVAQGTAPTTTCKAKATYSTANCGAPTANNWYVVLVYTGNVTIASVFTTGAWAGYTASVTAGTTEFIVVGVTALQNSGDGLVASGAGGASVSGTSGAF